MARAIRSGVVIGAVGGLLTPFVVPAGLAASQASAPALPSGDPMSSVPESTAQAAASAPLLYSGRLQITPASSSVRLAAAVVNQPSRIDAYIEFDGPSGPQLVPAAWTLSDGSGDFTLRLDPRSLPARIPLVDGGTYMLRLLVSSPAAGGFTMHSQQVVLHMSRGSSSWSQYGAEAPQPGVTAAVAAGIDATSPNLITVPASGPSKGAAQAAVTAAASGIPSTCRPITAQGALLPAPPAKIVFSHFFVEDLDNSDWSFASGIKNANTVSVTVQDGQTVAGGLSINNFPGVQLSFSGSMTLTGTRSSSGTVGVAQDFVAGPSRTSAGGTANLKYYTLQTSWMRPYQCLDLTHTYRTAFLNLETDPSLAASRGTNTMDGGYLARGSNGKYLAPCESNGLHTSQPEAQGGTLSQNISGSVTNEQGYQFTLGVGASSPAGTLEAKSSYSRTTGTTSSSDSYWGMKNVKNVTQYLCTTTTNSISAPGAFLFGLGTVSH